MRRVVVTGVGAVSPLGADTATTWKGLLEGRSGIGPITRFDAKDFACRIAGECRDFDVEKYFEKKRVREGDRFIHLAMGASAQAIDASGFYEALSSEDKERVGTFMGVGLNGLETIERTKEVLLEKGPRRISPYFIPASISNCSSNARTSSTIASESAPRSSMNCDSGLICATSTSSCWETISLTLSAISIRSSLCCSSCRGPPKGPENSSRRTFRR